MSDETNKHVSPPLRFSEFKDAEDWKERTFDEIGTFTGGGTPSRTNQAFWQGNIPWISSSDIDEDSIFQLKITRFITEEALKDSATKRVPPNSILLVSRVGVGKLAVSKESICTSQDFTNFTPADNDLIFLAYLLKSHKKILLGFSQGMAIKGFTKDDISKLRVPIPAKKEQQKIAACLSSLDELIAAEIQNLDALKVHKNGLMQQLFPAEGETVPKLRFAGFIDSGDWEKAALGSAIEIKGRIGYRGYTTEDIVKKGEGAISLSPSNFRENGSIDFEKSTYISWAKYEESPEIMLNDGFTVLVKTGSSYGKVALVKNLAEKSTINPQIVVLKPLNINPVFLFLMVKHSTVQKQIKETVVGGAIPTLSQESISKFEVFIPGLNEQQKIASCFSYLDEIITALSEKIEALKDHKKGLMQQLFPHLNKQTII